MVFKLLSFFAKALHKVGAPTPMSGSVALFTTMQMFSGIALIVVIMMIGPIPFNDASLLCLLVINGVFNQFFFLAKSRYRKIATSYTGPMETRELTLAFCIWFSFTIGPLIALWAFFKVFDPVYN
ncbi:hypothetical protein F0P96_02040 [Hymenobacter busanensis]|uniref:Uncharacterized protein n=1 Tax=Hymenobacter busanensis TaxID=2607656 RepID=A0A7L4ZUY0_9BACT|nr:hypothetical protein [Hymenobacter busanensis]KAA9339423.1 hypothetical protein F0P96_02040 [Hymenobacter busanensis]QHJ06817.1 hypothetical protein GUY19_05710 [Hymenobacter busanensis]